ncbi:MAG: hypothetical protein AB1807_21730 [Pseudomonadota bacterium]
MHARLSNFLHSILSSAKLCAEQKAFFIAFAALRKKSRTYGPYQLEIFVKRFLADFLLFSSSKTQQFGGIFSCDMSTRHAILPRRFVSFFQLLKVKNTVSHSLRAGKNRPLPQRGFAAGRELSGVARPLNPVGFSGRKTLPHKEIYV